MAEAGFLGGVRASPPFDLITLETNSTHTFLLSVLTREGFLF